MHISLMSSLDRKVFQWILNYIVINSSNELVVLGYSPKKNKEIVMTSTLPYEDPQFPCSAVEYQWCRPLEFL